MSTPTKRPLAKQPASGKAAAKSTKATRASGVAGRARVKQTARVSGLRDGKPLIFGWGRDFTRAQKTHYQHLAVWSFIGLIALAILGTMGYGVFNELVLVPNKTIATVNGTNITQDAYRKELAFKAQTLWNKLQYEIAQKNAVQPALQKGDQNAINQDTLLSTQIQADEVSYGQAQITSSALSALQDNQLIMVGEQKFEQSAHVPSSTFEPTQKQVSDALATFKKQFPNGETYAQFLSANGISDADVTNSITIELRRTNMQNYLSKQITSPSRQVHLRRIEVDTAANATKIRAELVKGNLADSLWASLAAKNSLDTNSKDVGGDMGFVPAGTGDGGIEYWAYDASRKVGDLSPVIADTSGTFDVVQVLGIDPAHTTDAATLKAAQDNALSHWLQQQRTIPGAKVVTADATMLTAARNLPKKPDLSATLPAITPTVSTGIPGLP